MESKGKRYFRYIELRVEFAKRDATFNVALPRAVNEFIEAVQRDIDIFGDYPGAAPKYYVRIRTKSDGRD